MALKPLDDRIVVKPNEAETQTASGLVIPDTAKEKPQQGSVLAVGPGKRSDTTGELIPLDIKVGDKFRRGVIAGMFGMVGLGLLSLVLSFFGIQSPLYGSGPIGFLFALAGLVLGVFMLILDFDFVENGVAAGLPERESWRAAFGLTVSLVWIYTNLLRILAIMRGD